MGKTALKYNTKTITTTDGNANALFATPTLVYSVAVEMHEDSSEATGWCGASDVTTTNKTGRAFTTTNSCEFQSRWRFGAGGTSNLIDASTIYVASPSGADILVTYLLHETD